jgi:hypothetical protein
MWINPERCDSQHQYIANEKTQAQMVGNAGEALDLAGCNLINHVSVMGQHVFEQLVQAVNIAVMSVA